MMLKELFQGFESQNRGAKELQDSIVLLRKLGEEWEALNKFASYYFVKSIVGNSVALMWGDIRHRTSYTSILTLFLDDHQRLKVNTVNFDSFQDEQFELNEPIPREVILRCLSSSYSKSIITNIRALFEDGDEKCTIQVRTGVFWSDMEIDAGSCQKIFDTLKTAPRSFTYGRVPSDMKADHLPYDFMKQMNQVSINGIKFTVRIKRQSITFEVLAENDSTELFK